MILLLLWSKLSALMCLKTSRDMPQNVPWWGKLDSDYRTTDRENLTGHLIFAPVHDEHPVKIYVPLMGASIQLLQKGCMASTSVRCNASRLGCSTCQDIHTRLGSNNNGCCGFYCGTTNPNSFGSAEDCQISLQF